MISKGNKLILRRNHYFISSKNIFKKFYPAVILLIIGFIYLFFKIKTHTWETYMYAISLENVFDLRSQYVLSNLHAVDFPYINFYHPNHPLLYLMGYVIQNILIQYNLNINSLNIIQLINIIAGLTAIAVSYFIAFKISRSKLFSSLTMAVIAFLDVYWYQSSSGEVYIVSYALICASFLCLIIIYQSPNKNLRWMLLTSILSGLALGFHLLSGIFFMVLFFFLILIKKEKKDFKLLSHLAILILTGLTAFTVFYIAPFIFYYKVTTISSFVQIISLYSPQFGFWNTENINFFTIFIGIFKSLWIGFEYISRAILQTDSIIINIIRIMICIFLIFHLLYSGKTIFKKIFIIWFWIYFIAIALLLKLPNVNDYWCFNLYPLIYMILLEINKAQSPVKLLIFSFLVMILFCINFMNDIYPKYNVKNEQFYLSSRMKPLCNPTIVVVMNNYMYQELWFNLTCFKNKKIYYIFEENFYRHSDYENALNLLIDQLKNEGELELMADQNTPTYFKIINIIKANSFVEITHKELNENQDIRLYKYSIGNQDKQFKFVYKNIVLSLYKKINECNSF
jgi:hypothetical protein